MAHNKHNTRPYKKCGLIPKFHLPTRIITSSHLNPSSLLHLHSPVPSPPLTPVPDPKEDHILFLPRPPYTVINNPHFHHDVSKSITSYMVQYLYVTIHLISYYFLACWPQHVGWLWYSTDSWGSSWDPVLIMICNSWADWWPLLDD